MKLVLDACVLVPPVLRALLLELAHEGLIEPVWSDEIITEWLRVAERQGDAAAAIDAQLAKTAFPGANVLGDVLAVKGSLPDATDAHVIATGIAAQATGILTFNIKDFPLRVLGAHGLMRSEPDALLSSLVAEDRTKVAAIWAKICQNHKGAEHSVRKLGLRRFLKALKAN